MTLLPNPTQKNAGCCRGNKKGADNAPSFFSRANMLPLLFCGQRRPPCPPVLREKETAFYPPYPGSVSLLSS
ncbi:MAG: hypothetical protein BHW58_00635 [Azospirillum sp. 51_20]|nr:MAG: hypothetical protein BHW58_00635 [Azospirillum sp. 51_20]